jgi:hypothetical protein
VDLNHLIATSPDVTLKEGITAQVDLASARFTEALAGVSFPPFDPVASVFDPATIKNCTELWALLLTNPGLQDDAAINVYYVGSLDGDVRGYWCRETPDPPNPPNLILISTSVWSNPTLAHELGHASGLTLPTSGHADEVAGMSSDNLMWPGVRDDVAAARSRFTVGQIFRINFDRHSWLNNPRFHDPPPSDLDCIGRADPTCPCPRIAADVLPIANPASTLPGGVCL